MIRTSQLQEAARGYGTFSRRLDDSLAALEPGPLCLANRGRIGVCYIEASLCGRDITQKEAPAKHQYNARIESML